jgi:hypothetical protein
MLYRLIILTALFMATSCGASEARHDTSTSYRVLPAAARFALGRSVLGVQRGGPVILGQDGETVDAERIHPLVRARGLRTFGGIMMAVAGFPFLPAGIAMWKKGDSVDVQTAGMIFTTSLVPTLIFWGALALIHADILEDICFYASCGEPPPGFYDRP